MRWLYSLWRPARGDVGEEEGCIIKQDQVYLKLIKDGINIQEVEDDSLLKYTVELFRVTFRCLVNKSELGMESCRVNAAYKSTLSRERQISLPVLSKSILMTVKQII